MQPCEERVNPSKGIIQASPESRRILHELLDDKLEWSALFTNAVGAARHAACHLKSGKMSDRITGLARLTGGANCRCSRRRRMPFPIRSRTQGGRGPA